MQRGFIKGPQQRGFRLEDWEKGFKKHAGGESDRVLFVSGVWFHTHFSYVRASIDACAEVAVLTSPLSISALTAVANREWVVTNNKIARVLGERDRFVFEELDQTPLQTGFGNPIYFTNAIDTIVDGARFPLAQAAAAPVSSRATMSDEQWGAHVDMFGYGGYYHVLEHYWMHCVWNGYGVEILEKEIKIRPHDEEFHRKLTVSIHRRNARYNERAMVGASVYKTLFDSGALDEQLARKPVLSVFKKGGVFRVKADVAARFPARQFVYDEHLEALTKKRFPCLAGLSICLISDGFELLGGLPEQIWKFVSRDTAIRSWSQAEPLVPRIRRTELAAALRAALNLNEAQTNFILDYATWKPNPRRELWFSPLIRLDDEFVSLVCLALQGVNTIRLCDQLIADFHDLKPEADRAFEPFLRAELAETFCKSKLAGISCFLPNAFAPNDPAVGDIDVLFRIGSTIWVGEAKSVANLFSPNDDHNFSQTLHDVAVPQAQRKCAYVVRHLTDIAPLLGAEPSAVREVRPLVVTSNPAFAGFPIDGVPVVDWHVVELFFSDGAIRHMGYTTDDGRMACVERQEFYKSPDEAEQCFPGYLQKPPQIALPRKHVYEDISEMLPSPFFSGRPVRAYNYTVRMPTDGMSDLIQRVAQARGDWAVGESE